MTRTMLIMPLLMVLSLAPVIAQDSDDHLGKTCDQILAMKVEDWSELYVKKKQGGEVGYDQAYEIYAECMRKKNNAAIERLPTALQTRLQKYRELCGGIREDSLSLEQAYAGGGTLYTHAITRLQVDDEKLIASLARVYLGRSHSSARDSVEQKLAQIRRRIYALNPNTARNHKKLAEFSMVDQAETSFRSFKQHFAAISALLRSDRPNARPLVIKFLDQYSKPSISEE